ncbi:hypothetical protein FYZ48_06280 [Gimesia chilikensis]|uniref:hypothetical protein n=1 Tax=Gimesia chilikensis TaxID=2605989 RepID=UPI0011ECD6EC|nr:hypothetical protein [Gimesia chilikensis]KAA0140876.1 hypothetical protein FYZ48_06280 [Gimesia chilikensis]
MTQPEQIILDFVEGRIDSKDFEQHVYNDSRIEDLLKDDSLSWHDCYIKTNPFDFIICLNYDDPGGVLNAQGAMEMFLQRKGIQFQPSTEHSDLYELMLDAQPKWLCADSAYLKSLLTDAGEMKPAELKKWLREKLLELFKYYKKPPRWIQNPAWPINENGPMYFLGQIKLADCELFHDEAAAYLFIDTTSGVTETVIQVF